MKGGMRRNTFCETFICGVVLRAAMKATGTAIIRAAMVPRVAMLIVSQIGTQRFSM